jgi:hypothetical protein
MLRPPLSAHGSKCLVRSAAVSCSRSAADATAGLWQTKSEVKKCGAMQHAA